LITVIDVLLPHNPISSPPRNIFAFGSGDLAKAGRNPGCGAAAITPSGLQKTSCPPSLDAGLKPETHHDFAA
jgi:hypothetical protein